MNKKILKNTIFEDIKNSNGKFTKHFHDTYTIGLTHDGLFKSILQNNSFISYKKSSRIINPGELHYGDSNSWKYTNFYPTVELISSIYEEIYFEKRIPIFNAHIINDTYLYKILLKFFYCVYNKEDEFIVQSNLIEVISYLIINYSSTSKKYKDLFDDKLIAKESITYIKDSLNTNLSLDELALNVKLSKFHFLRSFKKQTGLTPHQYILTQRIQKAKVLALNGEKLSEIAIAVGFNDQSHFIRNFRKIYGYSPKELLDKNNFIL